MNKFPTEKCYACQSDDWWLQNDETWLCGRCHPAAEDVRLKFRVIKGNHKLNIVLKSVFGMPHGERRDRAMEQYETALIRLKELRNQMVAQGSTDCLYIAKGKKVQKCLWDPNFSCVVCPNDYWWEKELMAYDREQNPEAYK